ncbi:exodeoxyribonuclease III [Caldithrix abyssi]|uniref:Exodeoxyribonuclease III Xth n=1 Tax=Caldithrix abyssi DSM 13497 TaxID=880073 RepID=H1XU74_CALAY|nr:exodeoxyribonuclease III [Caldithrix abyssi]APF17463.1 exodeoxyribonuclease-3 [Caldithrix abyssi DSM 13497]EHO41564.1 exodeoxyribonuclease III Xth [Caldithrix abyssi DSM 13497]
MKLISWNVNGLRAVTRNGFIDQVKKLDADIICLQETKLQNEQIPEEILRLTDYHQYWNFAQRKGYSGVATFSRQEPAKIERELGIEKFDSEGRVLITHYDSFVLFNVYFPNGQRDHGRVAYKLEFYAELLKMANALRDAGNKVIITGDFNTAHREIDLKNPKSNQKTSGFLPEERAWIDRYLQEGWIDTFRHFYPQLKDQYTWWSYRFNARQRNIGWRIDYFMNSENLLPHLKQAFILPEVMGSDHCPLGIELAF